MPSVPHVHRVASGVRSVRAVRLPRARASRREDGVNCVERPVDQIHDFFSFEEQCRESLSSITRYKTREQAGREKKGEDGEREKMRPPPLRAISHTCSTDTKLLETVALSHPV